MSEPTLHICYSDRHFHPHREVEGRYEWYSCAQIARRLWTCLSGAYPNVSYGDRLPEGPVDLLWSNRIGTHGPGVKRMAYFASVAHLRFVDRQVRRALVAYPGARGDVEGTHSVRELLAYVLTLARADSILGIGNACIERTFLAGGGVPKAKVTFVDCGVDHAHFQFREGARPPVFLHAATRFSRRKGSHLVALAWPIVASRHPECALVLMGRPGDVDVEAMLGARPRVEVRGAFDGGSASHLEQLHRARWMLLPSLAEGQAGTLLEAMSCGCVPVASRETGIDAERYGGQVVAALDVDGVVMAMESAINDSKQDGARFTREQVERWHSWPTFEDRVLEVTRKALAEPPGRGVHALPLLVDAARCLRWPWRGRDGSGGLGLSRGTSG